MIIKIDPMDEEIDYDGHKHMWKYIETYGDSGYGDGESGFEPFEEWGVKLYQCIVCSVEVGVTIE
jgi:hypothetical protein